MPIEECAGDRAHQQSGGEREECDRSREARRMEPLEREENEDELDHRRRRAGEQHAANEAREAVDLEELPIARPRLGGDRYFFCSAWARSQSSRRTSPIQQSRQRPSRKNSWR